MYKVLAKVISNRLRCVIRSVTLESYSTFFHGRKILDGILITNKMVYDDRRLKKQLLLFKSTLRRLLILLIHVTLMML